jgi:hypothetical protein
MRWWLRLLALSFRGSLERAVRRLTMLVVVSVTAALLLVLVGSLALRLLLPLPQKRLDSRWAELVADPAAVLDRFVPRGSSSGALRLVRAARAFGIELLPTAATNRSVDVASTPARSSELGSWCDAVLTGSGRPASPIPDAVRSVLDERASALDEIIATLTADEPITWELQSAMGGGSGAPSPGPLVELHRWLAAAAADRADRGDPAAASAALEASWRLNQESLQRPERGLRLAGYSILELDLAILRTMPRGVTDSLWVGRLDELDPVAKLDEWVLVEAYSLPASTRRGTVLDDDGVWAPILSLAVDPARRWLLMPASESLRASAASLSVADLATLDPDLEFVDGHHRIPRWNRLARAALPNPWHEWSSAARASLAGQLTAEVLDVESLGGEGLAELLATLPQRRESRVPGAFWMWTAEPEGLTIRLDVEVDPSIAGGLLSSPPLVHVVRTM